MLLALVLAVAGCQATALVLHETEYSGRPDVQGKPECTILTEKQSYRSNETIVLRVHLINRSSGMAYVLKENSSGGIWLDRVKKRVVVAHYAFNRERENELRGGWSSVEVYLPEFYEIRPGQKRFLRWNLGKKHERGTWQLEGKVSFLSDIAQFAGTEGTAAAEAIAKRDIVIPCVGKTIIINGTPVSDER